MHYAIRSNYKIQLNLGDMIEILEGFYRKYADEILVGRFRVNGKIYEPQRIEKSGPDMMPVKPHEGYVERIQKAGPYTILNIQFFAGGK